MELATHRGFMNFESYKVWSKSQPCIDCGRTKDGKGLWVTETQCLECWENYGTPENRGLPSTREMAGNDMVYI